LQGNRALRALRETPRKPCCNHSATQMRAFRWDQLGFVGARCDDATSSQSCAVNDADAPPRRRPGLPRAQSQQRTA